MPILKTPVLRDIYPREWSTILDMETLEVEEFRNLLHFKTKVKELSPKSHKRSDSNCGISYEKAVEELMCNKPLISNGEYQEIKNNIKNVLLKRGMISDDIYESYHYDVEGEIWDVSKVILGDPACFLKANKSYTNYFYELYINISYPHYVSNKEVMENIAKILATVELLETDHIYTKITLVLPMVELSDTGATYFGIIPLFGHTEHKSIEVMSAVLNDRLLRKFFFVIVENRYDKDLRNSYGRAIELPSTIRPMEIVPEELCAKILDQVIVGETR